MGYLLLKVLISAITIVLVSELAKHNNLAASVVHSLPLTSLLAFVWLYIDKQDAQLVGCHAYGTFWFVLPTLPLFLILPWLIHRGIAFWPSLGLCIVITVALYFLTMRLLALCGVQL
jgi:hypothetical protein